MEKSSSKLIAVLAVIAIGSFGYLGWKVWRRSHPGKPPQEGLPLEKLLEIDKTNLTKPGASPDEVYAALLRLGRFKDPSIPQEAFQRISDSNPMVRAAAADGIGWYDDEEALPTIKKGLKDDDRTARMGAIRGLGHQSSSERIQILKQFLQQSHLDDQEKVAALENLARISSASEKRELVGRLLAMANSGESQEQTDAALRAASILPEDTRVVQMLKTKLRAGKNERVMTLAIRHLASLHDPEVREGLSVFARVSSIPIRLSAVQALHEACPKDRWEILSTLMQSETETVVMNAAVREAGLIEGPQAREFLKKQISSGKLKGESEDTAQNALDQLEKTQRPSTCKE